MPLQKLPTTSLDNEQFQRRVREIINAILGGDWTLAVLGGHGKIPLYFGGNPQLSIMGAGNDSFITAMRFNSTTAFGSSISAGKSRSDTIGAHTIVQSGDQVGDLSFLASDGTQWIPLARIFGEVDGTPGVNDMPGRLTFHTTADGAASTTERLRIAASGAWGLAGANYGTAGEVLTSNGSSTAPTWQAAGGGGAAIDVQVFTADGTWTMPSGAAWVEAYVVGGGGGGGSGRKRAVASAGSGGGGGGSAGWDFGSFNAADLGATEAVVVGQGGTGGASQTTDSSNGNIGGNGGESSFFILRSLGGNGGAGGSTVAAGGGTAGEAPGGGMGPNSSVAGGNGLNGGTSPSGGGVGGAPGEHATAQRKCGAGGAAGGVTAGNSPSNGSDGSDLSFFSSVGYVQGTAGTTGVGQNGGSGNEFGGDRGLGTGGGGGAGNATSSQNAGSGGNGGTPGGGGGGGGAATNSSDTGTGSGAGGDGGRGVVVVVTYF